MCLRGESREGMASAEELVKWVLGVGEYGMGCLIGRILDIRLVVYRDFWIPTFNTIVAWSRVI